MANKYDKNELIALLESRRDEILIENEAKMREYYDTFEVWKRESVMKYASLVNESTPLNPYGAEGELHFSGFQPPTKPTVGSYQGLKQTSQYDRAIRQVKAMTGPSVELRAGATDITDLL